jgi:pyruvate formate lyase activating enzyme
MKEGQHGICFVRRNEDGRLRLLSNGRISGLAVDPVEKKPLYHFLPDTPTLSIGGIGCNLSCGFCQNFQISKPSGESLLRETVRPEEIARAARSAGCPSVSFTYNEPVIALEFVVETARVCRAAGLRTIAVTNGYVSGDARSEFFASMDAANVDLKAFTDEFYRRHCGARLAPVLDTLIYLKRQTNVWLETTHLLIPGENDSPAEIDCLTRWVVTELGRDVPMHFSGFFPAFRMTERPPTPVETLSRARDIAVSNGMRHVYVGNRASPEEQTTYCASCRAALIERSGMGVLHSHMGPDGTCPFCQTVCPGVFGATRKDG